MSARTAFSEFTPRESEIFIVPLVTSSGTPIAVGAGNEIFRFRFGLTEVASELPQQITIGLQPVEMNAIEESWITHSTVESGKQGNVNFSKCAEYLFCSISAHIQDEKSVRRLARSCYLELLDAAESHGHPYLVRAWNYFPHINKGTGDEERYRQFCLGRAEAFNASNLSSDLFPAGTAVGTQNGSLMQIVLLSGRHQARMVENSRQTSAYQYPRHFGPVSPSFARASRFDTRDVQQLFISGTASIVGSESRHTNDVAKQLDETLRNINVLLENSEHDKTTPESSPLFRVYLRRDYDLDSIRQRIYDEFGRNSRIQILRSDICRSELDIEIECIFWTS